MYESKGILEIVSVLTTVMAEFAPDAGVIEVFEVSAHEALALGAFATTHVRDDACVDCGVLGRQRVGVAISDRALKRTGVKRDCLAHGQQSLDSYPEQIDF